MVIDPEHMPRCFYCAQPITFADMNRHNVVVWTTPDTDYPWVAHQDCQRVVGEFELELGRL